MSSTIYEEVKPLPVVVSSSTEEKRRFVIELSAEGVGELTGSELAQLLLEVEWMFRRLETQHTGLEWTHHGHHAHLDPKAKFHRERRADWLVSIAAGLEEVVVWRRSAPMVAADAPATEK